MTEPINFTPKNNGTKTGDAQARPIATGNAKKETTENDLFIKSLIFSILFSFIYKDTRGTTTIERLVTTVKRTFDICMALL